MKKRPSRYGICAAIAAAVLLTGAVTACSSSGGGSGGKQTIRFVWWGNQDRATATQKAVAAFEAKNPNIKVQTEFSGYAAYVQKLTTQIAGGAAPDLIQLDRPTFGEYQQKHALFDLTPEVGKTLHLDQVPPALLAGEQSDGDQYAVPAGQTTQMLVYDSTLFTKAGVTVPASGWTWEQFITDMKKVGAATGTPGTTDFGWAIDWFDSWLHTRGKSLYGSDGQLAFTADDLTQFWTMTSTLAKDKGASNAQATTKMDGSTQNSALVGKKAASEINYDSNLTSYVSSYQGGSLKTAPLPSDGTGPAQSGMAALPPVYFAVPKQAGHHDAALKLLDFLINDPSAGTILGATRGVPPNQQVRQQVCSSSAAGNQAVCAYEASVKDKIGPSASWYWPSGSSAIKTDFQQVYDNVIFGKSSVSDAANQLINDAKQSLSS